MIDREDWQDPAKPVSGPGPKGERGAWVVHYPGGPGGVVGAQVAPFLRGIQAAYLRSRGYSIGYNFGIAQDGTEWEIRGDDYNNAANAGRKVAGNFNHVSQSIFVMVDEQDAATPAAVATINARIATHPDWEVFVHSDVDYTSCAGIGVTAQVKAGVIGHQPEPDPTPPPRRDIMLYIAVPTFPGKTNATEWLAVFESGDVRRAVNSDVEFASVTGVPFIDLDSQEHHKYLLQVFGI